MSNPSNLLRETTWHKARLATSTGKISAIRRINLSGLVRPFKSLFGGYKSRFEDKTMSIPDEREWDGNRNAKILLWSYLFY